MAVLTDVWIHSKVLFQ